MKVIGPLSLSLPGLPLKAGLSFVNKLGLDFNLDESIKRDKQRERGKKKHRKETKLMQVDNMQMHMASKGNTINVGQLGCYPIEPNWEPSLFSFSLFSHCL